MADRLNQEEHIRRRQRGIAFFDYGHSSPLDEKSSMPRAVSYQTASEQYAVQIVRLVITALRGLAILLAVVVFLGIGLRGVGSACTHLPSRTPGCGSALIESTTPYLSTFKNGTTPLTETFKSLTNVVQMAPSLSVLGTAMHLVSANFSSTHDELKQFPEVYQTKHTSLDTLTETLGHALGAAELLSRSDFSYRDESLLWGHNGMETIGKMVDTYTTALNEHSTLTWGLVEQVLHRIPFTARYTPSYDIAYTYFYFGGQQWLEIEQLVHMANDSSTLLTELTTNLSTLSTHLEKVSAENKVFCAGYDPNNNNTTNSTQAALCHLDPSLQIHKVQSMLSATRWTHSVVSTALSHYTSALSNIKAPTNALQLDVSGYTSFLPSKGTTSARKLRQILETEMQQLTQYSHVARRWEKFMAKLGKELTKGEDVGKLNEHVNAAVVSGMDHRWWSGVKGHGEL
ncbi:hypothetical protein DOTSEDRAFT_26533 [Dothistroma septosporum NZE10]|uniref:Uncharacterized protein n=1 Tax=Dothistroma septosporum (strain NZE10 / CBS 128990) TaxID=675120 RepID=N1PG57_DOTSN|nr:hypothetical protein DOTSEDRAFT_26533 [Dothistroma septosporum NZE10]